VCPCSDMPRARPLPATLPPPSANRCQPVSAFRPRGFSPPRRFTPHSRSRACCIPVPEGVRRVCAPQATASNTAVRRRPHHPSYPANFPAAPFTPLEEVPPTAAVSHLCDRCLLAVRPPPRPLYKYIFRCDDPRPRGVAPLLGMWHSRTVAGREIPSPSMGFASLQGSGQARIPRPKASPLRPNEHTPAGPPQRRRCSCPPAS